MKSAWLWVLASITDHNGKPSYTRMVSWLWTIFSIKWISHEVLTTNAISDNAVMLVVISLIGPMFSIMMKKAPAEASMAFLGKFLGRKKSSLGSYNEYSEFGGRYEDGDVG